MGRISLTGSMLSVVASVVAIVSSCANGSPSSPQEQSNVEEVCRLAVVVDAAHVAVNGPPAPSDIAKLLAALRTGGPKSVRENLPVVETDRLAARAIGSYLEKLCPEINVLGADEGN